MNGVELWTVLWIPACVAVVIIFGFSVGWVEDLFERRKARHPAE